MLFFGRYEHSIDEKSRLMLPTKLREKLPGTLYMTYGLGKCIYLYPEETFMEICKDRSKLNDLSKEELGFKRVFFSNTSECNLDKQGRILITKNLMEKVGITKDVVIAGNEDHIEIWDKERYEQAESEYLDNFEAYAEAISQKMERNENEK